MLQYKRQFGGRRFPQLLHGTAGVNETVIVYVTIWLLLHILKSLSIMVETNALTYDITNLIRYYTREVVLKYISIARMIVDPLTKAIVDDPFLEVSDFVEFHDA